MNSNDSAARWERAVSDAVAAGVPGAVRLARRLNPDMKVTAEQYGDICDVIARAQFDIPDTDPYKHTSDLARAGANRIIEILGLEIDPG